MVEELLVDDAWKQVEVEPEPVAVNGNEHHEEAHEPQQSLFSWDELMAEVLVEPKSRSRKPQPVTLSMFAWALIREQGRGVEPVGAMPSLT